MYRIMSFDEIEKREKIVKQGLTLCEAEVLLAQYDQEDPGCINYWIEDVNDGV